MSDLAPSYSTPFTMQGATSVDTTTSPFNPHANSIQIIPSFSDGNTSCDLELLNDDGTGTFQSVATFTGINLFNSSTVSFGEFPQNETLGARAIKIVISNLAGGGTVALSVLRLN